MEKIWWYSLNNEQKGPVTADELNLLSSQNFITSGTLVWKQGLQNWIPYSNINAQNTSVPPTPPLPDTSHLQPNSVGETNTNYAQSGSAFSQPNVAGQPSQTPPQTTAGFSQPAHTFGQANQGSSRASGFPPSNPGIQQPPPNYHQSNAQPVFNSQQHTSANVGSGLNQETDPYYKIEFEKIMSSNESYKGKWNWWAFFFNWIWCFTKGLWQYALLILLPILIIPYVMPYMFTNVYALAVAIVCGLKGNWFYYNLKVKNKQLF